MLSFPLEGASPRVVVQLLAVHATADGGRRRQRKHFPGQVFPAAETKFGSSASGRGRLGRVQNRNRKLLLVPDDFRIVIRRPDELQKLGHDPFPEVEKVRRADVPVDQFLFPEHEREQFVTKGTWIQFANLNNVRHQWSIL